MFLLPPEHLKKVGEIENKREKKSVHVDDEGQLWRLPAVSVSQQKAKDQRYRRSAGGLHLDSEDTVDQN